MELRRRPCVFAALLFLLLAGNGEAVVEYTLTDNLSSGPGGYAYNNLYFEAAPDPGFSLDIYTGRTRVTSPEADTTHSLGFGGWMELTRKLDITVDFNTYYGAKAQVMRMPDMVAVREKTDRFRAGTLSGTLGLNLLRDSSQADGEEGGNSARLSLGVSSADQAMPVFIERWAPLKAQWIEKELNPYTVHDRAYSAGLSFGLGSTTLSAVYKRHHYSLPPPPPEASRPQIARMLDSLATATVDMLPPFPRYESGVKLVKALPMRLGLTAAYDYILSDRTGQVSRYMTGEVSWEAFPWLELRIGSYWDREYHETFRYNTAGLSLYF